MLKARIRDVFSRSYCCYGNLLYKQDDQTPFLIDKLIKMVNFKLGNEM